MQRYTFRIVAMTLVLTVAISVQSSEAQVSDAIQTIIERGAASDAFWSVVVSDSTGYILEEYNSEKLVRPASTFKLVTSAVYLDQLGPDYRFETSLYGTGEQDGNTWKGDLIIRGSGDPTISGEFYDGNAFYLFDQWKSLLDTLGINKIDGNLIGNESYFDDIPYPQGWEWDDLSYYYGVEINALSFNNNVVNLEVLADGEVGSVPEIQWFPFNTPFVDFINEQVITPTNTNFDESYRRILGSNTIVLRSKLPRGYYETEPLSITHPSLYFIDTFKRFLENEGITISGRLITDRQNRNWEQESDFTLLDTHTSVPLREIISRMNKESDNFYAEMLLKTIAAEHYNVEGSTELGIQLVKQFLDRNGIDGSKTEIRDASGMAPATLLRTMDLNQLLSRIKTYSWYNDFYNSLSIAGNDGTLRYRFRQSPVVNRFNGKSGYMSGVRAINGYLATSSGQELIVTIATNNYTVRTVTVDHLHERILEVLYNLY